MLISHSKEFVFLHNPKCGGTTVRQALMPFETTANFFWMFVNINERKVDKAHMPISIMRDHFSSYFSLLERFFVFMIVRNPYDRIVSAFNEINPDLYAAASAAEKHPHADCNYKAALKSYLDQLTLSSINGFEFRFRHCVRQIDLCFIGRKRYADVILKLEEWPNCLDKVAVFSTELRDVLANAKQKNERPLPDLATSYLDDDTIKKINRIYADDFKMFGYDMLGV